MEHFFCRATGFDSTGETETKADAAVEVNGPAEVEDAAAGGEADVNTAAESEVGVAFGTESVTAGETNVDAAAEAEADVDTTGESGLGMWAPVSTCGWASSG